MISHISIKDFAIIEDLDLDLNDGLNIITGETGAGKSIIIEAISLALGARADSSFVRTGKDKAYIALVADRNGEEVVISRDISSNGRNVCRINGQIATLSQLQELCKDIADIHGQYDHQSLLDPENHISLVDTFGGNEIREAKDTVQQKFIQYTETASRLSSLVSGYAKMQREKDFMEFELNEINNASLCPNEDNELEERVTLLQNSEKIYQSLENAYALIYSNEDSISSGLSKSSSYLTQIQDYSEDLKKAKDQIDEISYSIEDIAFALRDFREKTVFDPNELEDALQRLAYIDNLKKKYNMDIDGILGYKEELTEKLSIAINIDEEKDKLEKEKSALEEALSTASRNLSNLRKYYAKSLSTLILEELKELNFHNADLEIAFKETETFTREGIDIVEFMITTNKGESLKPLAKIASGGEMSRIMLAFKKIVGDYDKIPTMIFDEIDAGISGITASIVGRKLAKIAANHQIICITHLPQIASMGKYNYMIQKKVKDNKTFTDIIPLDKEGKIREIARLLGGDNITDTTLKSAKELIEHAN